MALKSRREACYRRARPGRIARAILAAAALLLTVASPAVPRADEPFIFRIEVPEGGAEFAFGADRARLDIDWGDGSGEAFEGYGIARKRYGEAGDYEIALEGEAARIHFYGGGEGTPEMLVDILSPLSPGIRGITSAREMFAGATRITEFSAEDWFDQASANVTDMRAMFRQAENFNQDLNNWDTSRVTRMGGWENGTFWGAESFNGKISDWDTSGVIDMTGMFRNAKSFNGDIGGWDVSAVRNMTFLFFGASSFNGDIGRWDVSGVTSMYAMFMGAGEFNRDIGEWNVSSVTDMRALFRGSAFNRDIGTKLVSKGTEEEYLAWDVSNVERMGGETTWHGMFEGTPFKGDISNWDVRGVTDMRHMFRRSDFDGDISGWDISWASYLGNLGGFLEGAELSPENYDRLLVKWSRRRLGERVEFDAGASSYSAGFPARMRKRLAAELGWEITDGGSTGEDYGLVPVMTLEAAETGPESARLEGVLVHLSAYGEARVYFEYREMGADGWIKTPGKIMSEAGGFSEKVEGLNPGTFHEFRSVSAYDGGEYHGNVVRFRTR